MQYTQIVETEPARFRYQTVVEMIRHQIDSGTLRAGDRLPSLRSLGGKMRMSVPTIRQAYLELERLEWIEARPKSGYFVRPRNERALVRKNARRHDPVKVCCRDLIDEVNDAIHKPGVLPLGVANPTMVLPATKTLHRAMKRVMSVAEERAFAYAPTSGEPALKRQLAYRYLSLGVEVDPDALIITNGAQEALALALQSVASPGDVIAVESPTYNGHLELIETLGMRAIEIETCPLDGIEIDALNDALECHPIAACIFSSAINNPLGSLLPDGNRQRLVSLLESKNVPLIEDDVYGDLVFEGDRPRPARAYSKKGLVLTCSSFSKTVAPGYRVGWIVPGRSGREIVKLKRAMSCASGLLQQLTLAEFLGSGDFDRYLRRLVPVLRDNAERMACAISRSFPESARLSRPRGGSVIWVEVPGLDSVALFREALAHGVSVMPGTIFAARNRYKGFVRISYGHPWDAAIEHGVRLVGDLVQRAG